MEIDRSVKPRYKMPKSREELKEILRALKRVFGKYAPKPLPTDADQGNEALRFISGLQAVIHETVPLAGYQPLASTTNNNAKLQSLRNEREAALKLAEDPTIPFTMTSWTDTNQSSGQKPKSRKRCEIKVS